MHLIRDARDFVMRPHGTGGRFNRSCMHGHTDGIVPWLPDPSEGLLDRAHMRNKLKLLSRKMLAQVCANAKEQGIAGGEDDNRSRARASLHLLYEPIEVLLNRPSFFADPREQRELSIASAENLRPLNASEHARR